MMKNKLKVGVIGATGYVGQRFVTLLSDHPWFDLQVLAASPRSAGKTYAEAVEGRWKIDRPVPEMLKSKIVLSTETIEDWCSDVDFVF